MNILFLTLYPFADNKQNGIYPDLINEFVDNGHSVFVVSPCERKNKSSYKKRTDYGNLHLISALISDYFGEGFIKKGISSITIGRNYYKAVKDYIPEIKFDLILYSTPPITFSDVIKKIKKRDGAYAYLLLKDIWPQGPIDIGALSVTGIKGIVSSYYRYKERQLYEISDYIGCMSKRNRQYLIENDGIPANKIEICPNSIRVQQRKPIDKSYIRNQYGLPQDKTIYVYGGNLGIAQGIDYVISCLKENEQNLDKYILIVGSGTEYGRLQNWFNINKPCNSKLLAHVPSNEYMELIAACDVGLIFLDHRFTIPNFPSRLLSYMEVKIPVLASTDCSTDIGEIIEAGEFGFWCESIDPNDFMLNMVKFENKDKRVAMGQNGYNYLKRFYTVAHSYSIIMNHFRRG